MNTEDLMKAVRAKLANRPEVDTNALQFLQEAMDDGVMDTQGVEEYHFVEAIAMYFSDREDEKLLMGNALLMAMTFMSTDSKYILKKPSHVLWVMDKVVNFFNQAPNPNKEQVEIRAGLFMLMGYLYSIGVIPEEPIKE
jgi:hypothetical protein